MVSTDATRADAPPANSDRSGALLVTATTGAVAGAVAVPGVVVAGAGALGFTAGGIASGSTAASMMSLAGSVQAGSLVATLQSIGATGALGYLGTAGASAVVTSGAVVGAAVGFTIFWLLRRGAAAAGNLTAADPAPRDGELADDGVRARRTELGDRPLVNAAAEGCDVNLIPSTTKK